jgi:hypothetical protein
MRLIEQNIDPEDHATLDTLALGAEAGSGGTRTLADIIFDRLNGDNASKAMEEEGGPLFGCDQEEKTDESSRRTSRST